MSDNRCDQDTSLPDWIIEHPGTFAVFEELGIDYSCGGKSLAHVCREQGLDVAEVLQRLAQSIAADDR